MTKKSRIAPGKRRVAYLELDSTWEGIVHIAGKVGLTPSDVIRSLTSELVQRHKDTSDLAFAFIPKPL